MRERNWSIEKANEWYQQQPWLLGCNFVPSTAINQIEMWQASTFDLETIDRELGWAAAIGFNTMRVFLHDLVWQTDAEGFKRRINQYLEIAARHGIQTMFVFFDDCWNTEPRVGKQPEPVLGIHNSGWVQSPGVKKVIEPLAWPDLESYVKDILNTFAVDPRIVIWDLYNEPGGGNTRLLEKSLGLLQAVFHWARMINPSQPLTSGIWFDNQPITDFQLEASDIVTFHHYADVSSLRDYIQRLAVFGRPLICTEYMARSKGSRFATHLPLFEQEHIGCYNWGLVSGKTQTIYPWESLPGTSEPIEWFHDVLRRNGQPFDPEEANLIKQLSKRE
jgi:endo-1,4-beta-mannosidase